MSYKEEFITQWESVYSYLDTEMIQQSDIGNISFEQLQDLLENEKKRWFLRGEYNYAWLEKLRSDSPQIAEKFEQELDNVKLEPAEEKNRPSNIFFLIFIIVGLVMGCILGKLFLKQVLLIVIVIVGFGYVGGRVWRIIAKKKNMEINDEERSFYLNQIKDIGEKLSSIVL